MSTTPDIETAFKLSLKLSRLAVGGDKHARLSADLGSILTYVNSIEGVDTEQTEPLLSPLQLSGHAQAPLREDRVNEQEAPLARALAATATAGTVGADGATATNAVANTVADADADASTSTSTSTNTDTDANTVANTNANTSTSTVASTNTNTNTVADANTNTNASTNDNDDVATDVDVTDDDGGLYIVPQIIAQDD